MTTRYADTAVVASAVMALSAQLRAALATLLRETDLSGPLADALWALDPGAGPLSRRTVAGLLHCDASNVTFLADRLEERGLVERVSDPSDRRVRALRLTAQGRDVRERLDRALTEGLRLDGLADQDVRRLAALLGRAGPRTP